ncbi:MAG: selenocysteine-specific translation elongation factor [Planctomycetota bacterium]
MNGVTLVVGLAGHVDHGKTSLVRALTGTDTDRLEEERRRGLTIELGFAHAEVAPGVAVSFVDVPGHERFVRTMASGVSGIDAAVLVVDAREGVMPQTREHADILRLLGVARVLAVVSKSDLVGPDEIASAERGVRSLLGGAVVGVVPCSAKTGAGLGELRAALASLPANGWRGVDDEPFRMPIDRVFAMKGSGTVVTGTVWRGTARAGDALVCAPDGARGRVRGVQSRGVGVGSVGPGQRAALNIAFDGPPPLRGQDLVTPGCFVPTRRLTVALELLGSCARGIRSGTRVLAMLGTLAEPASVKLVDTRALEPGGRALALLIFAAPVIASGGQTLLVRAGSPETTIGGGVVRSVFAPGLGQADSAWHDRLRALDGASPAARLACAAWALGERSWEPSVAHQEAGVWGEATPGVAFGSGRIDAARLEGLSSRVVDRVAALSDGRVVKRSRVVASLTSRAEGDVLAVIDRMVSEGRLVETGSGVALAGSVSSVSDEDRAAIDAIVRVYESYGAAPLPVDDVAPEIRVRLNETRRLVNLAAERGELVHVSGFLFLAAPVAETVHASVRTLIRERGSVTVGDIRGALGVTRKHAVPICEYLDRVRITKRVGNERVLCEHETSTGGV